MRKPMQLLWWVAGGAILCTPAVSLAHPGHDAGTGFAAGALHPWAGFDHLLALVAIGLLAARMGGHARLAIPLAFLATLAASASCGLAGMEFAFTEFGIGASIVLTTLLVLTPPRRLPSAMTALTALFAVFHGQAHGAEAASGISPALFIAGLITSSAVVIFAAQLLTKVRATADATPPPSPISAAVAARSCCLNRAR